MTIDRNLRNYHIQAQLTPEKARDSTFIDCLFETRLMSSIVTMFSSTAMGSKVRVWQTEEAALLLAESELGFRMATLIHTFQSGNFGLRWRDLTIMKTTTDGDAWVIKIELKKAKTISSAGNVQFHVIAKSTRKGTSPMNE
uniref:Uncharacterized protein n=1 Tax=Ditylenchus dipsaci TaxID=166011 RepID=A0A915EVK3_9BILA